MKKSRAAQASPKTAENQQDQLIVADLLQIAQGLSQSLTETRHVLNSEVGWSAARTAWSKVSKHLQLLTASSNRVAAFDVVLSHKSDREFLELEMGLRETFAKQGWKVDGQWPKLFIERAIAVEFIEDSRSAVVGGTKIDHPSVSSIVAVLGPLIQNLVPKNFSAGSFFSKLGEAYDLARTGSSQVPIFDVYRCYVMSLQRPRFWNDAREERFIGLSIEQFRARLSRALESVAEGAAPGRGEHLRLLPPLDPKDSLFLYQPSEARFGFVGRIEFLSSELAFHG